MPRHSRKTPRPQDRRAIRQYSTQPPDVPVVVPGSNTPNKAKPSAGHSQSAAQPDPVDDRIRRMIEAAYT